MGLLYKSKPFRALWVCSVLSVYGQDLILDYELYLVEYTFYLIC